MIEAEAGVTRAGLALRLSAAALAAAAALAGWWILAARLRRAEAATAALAARLELAEKGRAAVEAVRGDLEASLAAWSDDEAGRGWLARCAFPVEAPPAGGAALPSGGTATLLLLVRPVPGLALDQGSGPGADLPLVRIVAWYPAESTESPALVSWVSEPLADARALAALPAPRRLLASAALARASVELAWDPAAPGPRAVDPLTGALAPADAAVRPVRGSVVRWCGAAPGEPVLARGLGHPAFAVFLSGPAGARRADVRLSLSVVPPGADAPVVRESAAVAAPVAE
ncbi:MAG: hypothetical protein IT452_21325 [Planctomycetia bacterium]|nr:hypothetical protein [Planctomycetia bacterium]